MPRPAPPAPFLTTPAAASDPAPACWAIIDRLVDKGGKLGETIKVCSTLGMERGLVKTLVSRLQACYLELGACCLGGVLGEGSDSDDTLPVSFLIKQV